MLKFAFVFIETFLKCHTRMQVGFGVIAHKFVSLRHNIEHLSGKVFREFICITHARVRDRLT